MDKKLEELLSAAKLNELIHRKQPEEKKSNPIVWILAGIGAVAAIAAIAYAVYYFFVPDHLEDFEDDFEDDYEDDFFDSDSEETGEAEAE